MNILFGIGRYWQSHTRGHQAVKDILENYKGVLTTDCWGAYNKLNVEQQKCLAHFVTELNEILHALGKKEAVLDKQIAEYHEKNDNNTAIPEPRGRGRPKKQSEPLDSDMIKKIQELRESNAKVLVQTKEVKDFLSESWSEGPRGWKTPSDKRVSKLEAEQQFLNLLKMLGKNGIVDNQLKKLLTRGTKYLEQLFTYLEYEGIAPDNNEAERALRPFVVQRKISGCFKNPLVVEVYHYLKSFAETCRKNGKDFTILHNRLLEEQDVDLATFFFDK